MKIHHTCVFGHIFVHVYNIRMSMYVCMYTIYICVCIYIYIYVCMESGAKGTVQDCQIFSCTVRERTIIHVFVYLGIYLCTCIAYLYMCVCVYVYPSQNKISQHHIHTCMHTCMHTWQESNLHVESEADPIVHRNKIFESWSCGVRVTEKGLGLFTENQVRVCVCVCDMYV